MDSLYPGWNGLREGSETLSAALTARATGDSVPIREWDWIEHRFRDGAVLHPNRALIVEGCGSLSRDTRRLVCAAVWLEAPAPLRYARATSRDGDDAWWDSWAVQERTFYATEGSRELADIRVDMTEPEAVEIGSLIDALARLGWPDAAGGALHAR